MRHIFAHIDGSVLDEESGLSHLAHAICCLLFKLEIELEDAENKEEGLRKVSGLKYSTSYRYDGHIYYGDEADNEKRGL